MPTPTGLPKVGERVRFSQSLPPDWTREWRYGVVVERGQGFNWAVWIRWDDLPQGSQPVRGSILLNGAWHLKQGDLEVLVSPAKGTPNHAN